MQTWGALVLAFSAPRLSESIATPAAACGCRSNGTHIAWLSCRPDNNTASSSLTTDRSLLQAEITSSDDDCSCRHQLRSEAEKDCLNYLRQNIMPLDVPSLETLGFPSGDDEVDADGLNNGLVGPTVTLALNAKILYSWTDALPQDVFYEYVLNYANVNEARSNWRPLLHSVVEPMVNKGTIVKTIRDVVRVINTRLWKALAKRESECIVFQSGQTPLIFDPMSVIAFGYASCTGLAILFIDALRAAGVPARLVGTPAWHGDRQQGNHNWVEVLTEDGEWHFVEPSPAQDVVDTLDRDPCDRWFCQPDRFPPAGAGAGSTQVYAARLDKRKADTHYPMAWEWNSTDVPGINRTKYYQDICSKCGKR